LGVAAREGRNLSPEAAVRIFMDDNCVILHALIFSWSALAIASPRDLLSRLGESRSARVFRARGKMGVCLAAF
jgi:hypothetical protein